MPSKNNNHLPPFLTQCLEKVTPHIESVRQELLKHILRLVFPPSYDAYDVALEMISAIDQFYFNSELLPFLKEMSIASSIGVGISHTIQYPLRILSTTPEYKFVINTKLFKKLHDACMVFALAEQYKEGTFQWATRSYRASVALETGRPYMEFSGIPCESPVMLVLVCLEKIIATLVSPFTKLSSQAFSQCYFKHGDDTFEENVLYDTSQLTSAAANFYYGQEAENKVRESNKSVAHHRTAILSGHKRGVHPTIEQLLYCPENSVDFDPILSLEDADVVGSPPLKRAALNP